MSVFVLKTTCLNWWERATGGFGYKIYDKDGYSGVCFQNVFITIANEIRIRIMNKVLLLKNTFEKMRNSDMVGQERLLDVNITFLFFFVFLIKHY